MLHSPPKGQLEDPRERAGETGPAKCAGPQRYRGFVLTPCCFRMEGLRRGEARWSIGVFLRTERQSVHANKFFRVQAVLVRTRAEAMRKGILFGRWLIDSELLPEVTGETRDEPSEPLLLTKPDEQAARPPSH
jgi:hypothetical protein